ncbi:MAG: hypothetical protein U1E65_20585 [Myxococcota bacterium]
MPKIELSPRCEACAALCCVLSSFSASPDFAIDKAAGRPCPYLQPDCRCAIYAARAIRGFGGCLSYDCYGAGQRLTEAWRDDPERGGLDERIQLFSAVTTVHELAWLLLGASRLCPPALAELRVELQRAHQRLSDLELPAIRQLDLEAERTEAHALLRRLGAAL